MAPQSPLSVDEYLLSPDHLTRNEVLFTARTSTGSQAGRTELRGFEPTLGSMILESTVPCCGGGFGKSTRGGSLPKSGWSSLDMYTGNPRSGHDGSSRLVPHAIARGSGSRSRLTTPFLSTLISPLGHRSCRCLCPANARRQRRRARKRRRATPGRVEGATAVRCTAWLAAPHLR